MRGFTSGYTTWHITFGTYGARLHGGARLTVDRAHNAPGEAVVGRDEPRERFERDRMRDRDVVVLSHAQRACVEELLPAMCDRGRWILRVCAAAIEGDHVHVLVDAPSDVHGKRVRRWLKTWLTESLDERWGRPRGGHWWAEGGSTKAVKNEAYLRAVMKYVKRQRTTR